MRLARKLTLPRQTSLGRQNSCVEMPGPVGQAEVRPWGVEVLERVWAARHTASPEPTVHGAIRRGCSARGVGASQSVSSKSQDRRAASAGSVTICAASEQVAGTAKLWFDCASAPMRSEKTDATRFRVASMSALSQAVAVITTRTISVSGKDLSAQERLLRAM